MKSFSKASLRIGTESAFAVGPEIMAQERKGFDIVKLNIGEPGCSIDKKATLSAINSFKNHETHYSPSKGEEGLRKKIARYMKATRGVDFDPEEIVLTPGGKPVIAATIMTLVNPGEEVIYPTPCYPIYESMVNFVGAKAKPILLKEEKGFRFDLKELTKLISKKTRLLILNSPSNPTGGVLEESDLEKIANLAKKNDFYVFSDEIYSRIVYGNGFTKINFMGNHLPHVPSIISQSGMGQRTVLMDGFSKTYAMTGLRLGFACSKNKKIIDKLLTFAINLWSCLPMPCMRAAEAVLDKDQDYTQNEIKCYQEKRDYLVKKFNQISGISCHKPKGAFYLFPNVTKVCQKLKLKDGESLRKYLLTYDKRNKKGVAVLARIHFGKPLKEEKEQYIRISFAGSFESLKEGVKRIKEAVN